MVLAMINVVLRCLFAASVLSTLITKPSEINLIQSGTKRDVESIYIGL